VNSGLFGEGSLRLKWKGTRGQPGLRPTLAIQGEVLAKRYWPGAVVLINAEVSVWELRAYLGSTVPFPCVLAWVKEQWAMANPPPSDEVVMDIEVLLHLDSAIVEALEELRQGGPFSLLIDTTVLLVDRGMPEGEPVNQPAVHYRTHPIITFQEQLEVSQHDWGQVLQQWGRGVGIPLVLPLVEVSSDPQRADVGRHLRDAWKKVDGADYSGSIAAARKAMDLLRGLSPATQPLPRVPKDRDIDQRIHAVLDALVSFASASPHVEDPIKSFQPQRSDAVAATAATVALAQQIFARLKRP